MKKPVLLFITVGAAICITSCHKDSSTPDTEEGNWVKRGQFDGPARTGAVSFVINDTAYVGTGYNYTITSSYVNTTTEEPLCKNHYLKDFFKLNMPAKSTGNSQTGYTWTQVAEMPGDSYRAFGVGFSVNNIGYVGLGDSSDGLHYKQDFYSFDGYNWKKLKNFIGTPRREATAFGLGSNGYITCGWDGSNTQKDMYQYFPGDDHWEKITALSGAKRRGASVFVYGSKAFIFGGFSSGSAVTDMWAFDSSSLTWSVRRSIANETDSDIDDDYSDISRENAATFVIDNYGYVTSGDVGGVNSPISSTWRYDFVNDKWTRRTALERSARTYALGFTIHNRGFVGTGQNGTSSSSYLDDFMEFIPSQTYDAND